MMKKILKIFGIAFAVLLLAVVIFYSYVYSEIKRGDLVKWEGKWYTKEAFHKIVPPQYYEAPSKNTPEEVYAKFREAILKNDIEGALSLIREKNREQYREAFKDKEKFDEWVKSLPENIAKENIDGNRAYYDLDMGTKNKNTASFFKNDQGYWEIDGI